MLQLPLNLSMLHIKLIPVVLHCLQQTAVLFSGTDTFIWCHGSSNFPSPPHYSFSHYLKLYLQLRKYETWSLNSPARWASMWDELACCCNAHHRNLCCRSRRPGWTWGPCCTSTTSTSRQRRPTCEVCSCDPMTRSPRRTSNVWGSSSRNSHELAVLWD